jgi:hypothetical protein
MHWEDRKKNGGELVMAVEDGLFYIYIYIYRGVAEV